MGARGAKVKLARKSRGGETNRKRPAMAGRPSRDNKVKQTAVNAFSTGRAPVPANDTALEPEALGLPSGVPVLDELEPDVELGATPDVAIETDETDEVSGVTAEAAADEDEDEDDEEEAEEPVVAARKAKRKGDDEPASFLAMYFRDMAELDVLRPEQEFETARNIEEMELDLWQTILGFAPGSDWVMDVVERELGKQLPEAKAYRVAATAARGRSSIPSRGKFEKAVATLAVKLRALDIDRIYLDASLAEIQRVGAVSGPSVRRDGAVLDVHEGVRGLRAHRRVQGVQAQGRQERVRESQPAAGRVHRAAVQPRPPPAGRPDSGGEHRPHEGRRAIRLSSRVPLLDVRELVDSSRHQPRAGGQGTGGRLPVHMIDAYHRIAKSQRELQSKLERVPTTQEIAAATGIEADKLEKMKTFLSETPVSLDRPISDEDGRRLIDVLVDPERGAGGSRADGLDRDADGDVEVLVVPQADRG